MPDKDTVGKDTGVSRQRICVYILTDLHINSDLHVISDAEKEELRRKESFSKLHSAAQERADCTRESNLLTHVGLFEHAVGSHGTTPSLCMATFRGVHR